MRKPGQRDEGSDLNNKGLQDRECSDHLEFWKTLEVP